MKKHTVLTCIFVAFNLFAAAQINQGKIYKINYYCSIDYLRNNKMPNAIGVLYAGENNSAYYQYPNPDYKKTISENSNNFVMKVKGSDSTYFVYKDTNKESLIFSNEVSFVKPLYEKYILDSLNNFKWQLLTSGDTMIFSLNCKSAKTFFRGREYKVWFSPDIPLNNGPWKFGGLPGLIVRVEEAGGELKWEITSITEVSGDSKIPFAPLPEIGYKNFKKEISFQLKKLITSMQSSDNLDPSCVGCKDAKIKIHTIENYLEN